MTVDGRVFDLHTVRRVQAGEILLDPEWRIYLPAAGIRQLPIRAPAGNFVMLSETCPTNAFEVSYWIQADSVDAPFVRLYPGRQQVMPWTRSLYLTITAGGIAPDQGGGIQTFPAALVAFRPSIAIYTGRNISLDASGSQWAPTNIIPQRANTSHQDTVTVSTIVPASHLSICDGSSLEKSGFPMRVVLFNRGPSRLRYGWRAAACGMDLPPSDHPIDLGTPPTSAIYFRLEAATDAATDVVVEWHTLTKTF